MFQLVQAVKDGKVNTNSNALSVPVVAARKASVDITFGVGGGGGEEEDKEDDKKIGPGSVVGPWS